MTPDDNEEKLIRSVALQNARAVLLARERAERELVSAKEALEKESTELRKQREFFRVTLSLALAMASLPRTPRTKSHS